MTERQFIPTTEQEPAVRKGRDPDLPTARPGWICLLLVLITFAVFWPLSHSDFINYDDPDYVTLNSHVHAGLTLNSAAWAFETSKTANWHPLTWLSHMLDVELFGLNPSGHHLMNVLLHAVNAALLLVVLRRLTGALWRSAFVAALFALHPLHVESVAWISERKDVLSTLFWLLTMWTYAQCARGSARGKLEHEGEAGVGRDALPRVLADQQVGPTGGQDARQGVPTEQGVPASTILKCSGKRLVCADVGVLCAGFDGQADVGHTTVCVAAVGLLAVGEV